jgi:G:T-mismatch repair DNA endonuclease (very short patch repair protein)
MKEYNIDVLKYETKEYQQRSDRLIKAVFIDNKPLVKRDKIKFVCERCKKPTTVSPRYFAEGNSKKLCRECKISIDHTINLDLELIKKLYLEEEMSSPEIAKKLNTTKKNILFRLNLLNISRSLSESSLIKIKKHPELHPGKFAYLGTLGNKRCNSKPELLVRKALEDNNINFKSQNKVTLPSGKIKLFDFWLPQHNTYLEVDGDYWHYNKNNPKIACKKPNKAQLKKMETDKEKDIYCKNNGIYLIRIWESELDKINQILKEVIR